MNALQPHFPLLNFKHRIAIAQSNARVHVFKVGKNEWLFTKPLHTYEHATTIIIADKL